MQKQSIFRLVLSICSIAIITSCSLVKKDKSNQQCPNQVAGTLINMSGLDGCGWMIQLDNQTKLNPTNLDDFTITLKTNKKVNFTYTENKDLMSTCMAGTIIDLICIRNQK